MRIHDISFAGQSLHPYSLRIDVPEVNVGNYPDDPDIQPFFNPAYVWMKRHFKYAIAGFERSEKGKPHLQCFCLHTRSYTNKELLKMRAHLKAHIASKSTKQPVSLKKSFSPVGLFKYCQKDDNVKLLMPDELFKYLEHLAQANLRRPREQVLHSACQKATSLRHLVSLLAAQCAADALHSMPRKAELWRLALRFHLITLDTFYEEFYAPRI